MVWIRIADPDSRFELFPKFNRDFHVEGDIYDKIFMKIRSLLREIQAELWKNAVSGNVEEDFKNSWIQIRSLMTCKV